MSTCNSFELVHKSLISSRAQIANLITSFRMTEQCRMRTVTEDGDKIAHKRTVGKKEEKKVQEFDVLSNGLSGFLVKHDNNKFPRPSLERFPEIDKDLVGEDSCKDSKDISI